MSVSDTSNRDNAFERRLILSHYIVRFSNSPTTTSSVEYSTTCHTSHLFLPAEFYPLSVV